MVLGDDDNARLMRRTIARYLCLAQVLVFRDLSVRVRKRFPTMESVVKAGLFLFIDNFRRYNSSLKQVKKYDRIADIRYYNEDQ